MGGEGESEEAYVARIEAMKKMRNTGTILDFQGTPTIAVAGSAQEAFNENWTTAEHDTGVAYICPWEDPHAGFPEHSRRCARALDDAGVNVHMRSLDPSLQWHMHFEVGGADMVALREQYDDLLTKSIAQYSVEIYQVVPDDSLLQRLTTHRFIDPKQLAIINRYRIISCVFERDRVSEHAVRCLNRVGMVWVANDTDKAMLERCGVERVAVVPIPHFAGDPLLKLRELPRLAGPVRFYHIGKWEPRKSHNEMIGLFLMTFKPGEAKLYFKTSTTAPDFSQYESHDDYMAQDPSFHSGPRGPHTDRLVIPYPSGPAKSVQRWLTDTRVKANGWTLESVNKDVHLIQRRISAEQIRQLHRMGDIYLSLSRGEGFDMPAYDSKLAGNMLVYTPSGGPQMYAGNSDVMLPFSGTIKAHPFYRWGDAEYGDWDMAEGAKVIRRAYDQFRQRGPVLRTLDSLRAPAVGAKMRKLVDEVLTQGKHIVERIKDGEEQT